MPANVDKHVKRGHLASFGLLILFSLIQWCIAAYLVATYNQHHNYPSNSIKDKVRFLLFTGLWTFVFSIVYVVGFLQATTSFAFSIASHAVWLFVTWVFWLSGAAAITAALDGGLTCSDWNRPHCNTLNALEGFSWLCWIIVTIQLAVIAFVGMRSARSGNGFGGAMVDV
ncbi:hypothetical protein JCM10207_006884 [Rhodosporidiobolus poonsookiae]